jgi:hypothetical protein
MDVGGLGGWWGEVPLLCLKVAVICALNLAGFHEDLGCCAVHALFEACFELSLCLEYEALWLAAYRSTTWLRVV